MRHLFFFVVLSSMAFGQGVIVPPQQALSTVNGVTSPISNATITICAANTSGIPCSPVLVSAVFKDAALTQPRTNPFFTDSTGNYSFAMAPGNYTVTVSAAGFVGYSYQMTVPLAAGANNAFTGNLTFSGNNTFSGGNTFSGTTNLNGGGSLTGTFTGGPATFSGSNTFATTGVFSNTQMNLFTQSILNSLNPLTEYQATQGAQFDTEALTAGVAIGSGSTVHQASAAAAYTNNSSTATNAVALYGQSRCLVNSTKCWGGNLVSTDAGSLTTGLTLYGWENDCNPASATSAYSGILCFYATMNSSITGTVGTAFFASTNHLGTLFWANAFFANDGSSAIAFNTGASCTTGTCASQPIQFDDFSSNVRSTATLVTDSGNSLVFTGAGMRNATASTTTIAQSTGSLIPQVGSTSQKAETGTADANVLTVTPPAVAGTYRACFTASVSSATAGVISWTLSWTDSNGNAQANIAQDLFQDGTAAPATTFTTSAAGNYHFCRELDVNNAAASIIVKWVGGGTTAAKVSATVERLI